MHPWAIHLIVMLLAVGLTGCGRPAPPAPPAPSAAEGSAGPGVNEQVQAFNLASYADDGQKRWEILGTTADMTDSTIHLTDLTATTYGRKASVVLTAKEGTFDRERQFVHLHQDVKAVTTEGTTLTTPSLDWDAERQMGSTEEWATVRRSQMTVQGQGASAAPQLKRVRFQRQVRVDLPPATTITCTGPLEVDYERTQARFWRQVHVQDPRGDIWADRLDAWMDPTSQQLTRVQCWGHVTIQQASQVAHARRADYQARRGTIVLIGHPTVTYYPHGVAQDGRTAP